MSYGYGYGGFGNGCCPPVNRCGPPPCCPPPCLPPFPYPQPPCPPIPIPTPNAGVASVFPAASATVVGGATGSVTVPLIAPATLNGLKAILETGTLNSVVAGTLSITLTLPAGFVISNVLSAAVFIGVTQMTVSTLTLNTGVSIVITGTNTVTSASTPFTISVLYV